MVSTWLTSGRGNAVARRHELVDRCRSIAAKRTTGSERMGRFQELAEQRTGQWRGESVTLCQANSPFTEVFHLIEVFDTLGEDLHSHAARELDQGFDDRRRVPLGADRVD